MATPKDIDAFLAARKAKTTTPGASESPSLPASGGSLTEYQGLSSTQLMMGEAGRRVQESFGKGKEDFLVPTVAVPKGVHVGKTAIDMASIRKAMATESLNKKREEYKAQEGKAPSAAWVEAWRKYETNQAHNTLMEWNREQRGAAPDIGIGDTLSRLWVDTDKTGAQESLAAQHEGKWWAPIAASVMGVNQTVYDGAKAESYNEGDFWGGLDYWGRFQASTYLATAAKAGGVERKDGMAAALAAIPGDISKTLGAWGSAEHLEEIQKGEDVVSLADDLGLGELNPAFNLVGGALVAAGLVEEDTKQSAADFSAGLAIAIIDPFDLFLLGKVSTAAAAEGGKLAGKAADAAGLAVTSMAKARRKSEIFREVAEAASDSVEGQRQAVLRAGEHGPIDHGELGRAAEASIQQGFDTLADESPGLAHQLRSLFFARMVSRAPVSLQTHRAFKQALERTTRMQDYQAEITADIAAAAPAARVAEEVKGAKPKRAKADPVATAQKRLDKAQAGYDAAVKGAKKAKKPKADPVAKAEKAVADKQRLLEAAQEAVKAPKPAPNKALKAAKAAEDKAAKALAEVSERLEHTMGFEEMYSLSKQEAILKKALAAAKKEVAKASTPKKGGAFDLKAASMKDPGVKKAKAALEKAEQALAAAKKAKKAVKQSPVEVARKALEKARKALETAQKKAAEPKKPRRSKLSPAEALEQLHLARHRHMATTTLLRDLLVNQKAIRLLSQKSKHTLSAAETAAAGAQWEKDLENLLVAQDALLSGGEAGVTAFEEASAAYQRSGLVVSMGMGERAIDRMDKLINEALLVSEAGAKDLDAASEMLKKVDPGAYESLEMDKLLKRHHREVSKIKKEGTLWAGRAAMQMFAQGARELSKGYSRLADMRGGGSMGRAVDLQGDDLHRLAALARDTERTVGAMKHLGLRNSVRGRLQGFALQYVEAVANIINPSARIYGTDSEVLQQIGGSMEAWVSIARHDLMVLGKGGTPEDVVARMNGYITSTEMMGEGTRRTVLNTVGDGTMWQEALPILRHMARGGAGNKQALEALAHMWLPSGDDLASITGKLMEEAQNLILTGSRDKSDGGVEAAAELTWEAFSAQMRLATADLVYTIKTKPGSKADLKLSEDALRSTAYGAQAVIEAALINRAARRTTKLVANLTPETMRAVERISTGKGHLAGSDYLNAMHVFDALEMPSSQRKLVRRGVKDLEAGLVHLGGKNLDAATKELKAAQEASAAAKSAKAKEAALKRVGLAKEAYLQAVEDSAIIPRVFMERMASRFEGIVKSADAYTARNSNATNALVQQKVGQLARLWNTSLLTGLVLQRPGYFTNIFVGNFAQMWVELGTVTAAKVTAQTVGALPAEAISHIPGIGKHWDSVRQSMAKSLGVDATGILPGVMQSMFNPHVARFYDPNLAKASDKMGGKFNSAMTYGELRRHAAEQGVLTSFVGAGSDLQNLIARTKHYSEAIKFWEKAGEKAASLKHAYADIADTIEQRQRVALFTDLITKHGMTPEQAGRKVRDSLYDWSAPITEFEQQYITKVFMFWNFSRKAMGQGFRNLTDAFVNDAGDSALDAALKTSSPLAALTGRTPYSTTRLTDMAHSVEAGKEFMRTYDDPEAENDPELAAVYPWWMKDAGSMMALTNAPLNAAQLDYNQSLGRNVTHRALAMPSFTPMEYASFWVDMVRMSLAAPFNEDVTALGALREMTFHTISMQGGNITGPAMKKALEEATGTGSPTYASESVRVKKLSDRAILGGLQEVLPVDTFLYPDAEEPGSMRVNKRAYAAYKIILPLSHELTNWIDPIMENAATRQYAKERGIKPEELKRGITWMARQWLGLGKEFYHAPEETLKYDEKGIKRKAGVAKHESRRRYAGEVDWAGRPK